MKIIRSTFIPVCVLILIAIQSLALPATGSGAVQTGPPDIGVSPTSLEVTLPQGGSTQESLILTNSGGEPLTFEFSEERVLGGLGAQGWEPLTFPSEKIQPGLMESIQSVAPQPATFLIYLTEQADLSAAFQVEDWSTRGQYVHKTLLDTAQASQADLISLLEVMKSAGMVKEYHPYHIVNAIAIEAGVEALNAFALRSDVAYIEQLGTTSLPEPIQGQAEGILAVEWGVSRIGADQVWSQFGVRGEGIVVANIDTGVLYTHPAVAAQYRGMADGSHDYNWFDPNGADTPFDNNGHGTHTMGTMVGDDGGSNQIGVAPAAQWIAAKGCGTSSCSDSDLLESAEWVLAPYPVGGSPSQGDPSKRPNVVNNSWGGGGGDLWYRASVQAWRAAGIFPAFSAGNSGPFAGTVGSPGDYAESFASGATDSSDTIASFSSRGPSSVTNETKPDVSSPGVNVRSAWNNGSYNTISGTSMASPHTAGCAALLLSADPGLDITSVENLMTDTAIDLGSSGPDTTYGYGRIDCYAAVSQALDTGLSWLSVDPVSGSIDPGDSQTIAVHFEANLTPGDYNGNLIIANNDPDENPVTVPVTLHVTSPTFTPTPTTQTPTPITPTVTPTHTPTQPGPTDTPTPTLEPGVLFFDDFESDRGWVRDPFGTDTATTGLWERGNPQGTSYDGHPMQLDLSVSGSFDLVTGPLAGTSVGSDDVDSGVTSIRSPGIRLPTEGKITLSFSYYMGHLFNSSSEDYLRVSVLGSVSGVVLEELGSPDDDDAAWETFQADLSGLAGHTIYLFIEAADNGDPSLVEAAIDDVLVRVDEGPEPTDTPTITPTVTTTVTPTFTPTVTTTVTPTFTPTMTPSPIIPTDTPTLTPSPVIPTDTPTVTPEPGVVFFDDFESDRGWTRDPFGSDTATTGLWARSNPQGTSYDGHPMQLDLSASGSFNLVTGPLAGTSVGSDDVDSGITSIRSPEIQLPASGNITLSFSYYLAHLFNSSADDFLRVTVVGSGSQLVFEELGSPDDDDAMWETFETSLNAFAGQSVYLLIQAADNGDPSLVEAGIDDLAIRVDQGPTPSPTIPVPTNTPIPEPGVIFFDDFESDLGWTRDPTGTDTATTGLWERGNPQGTSYDGHPMQLDTSASGSFNLVTGPLAGTSVGSDDIDSGVTSIRSPGIQLPASGEITLSFYYYLAHLFNASGDDWLRVSVVGASSQFVLVESGSAADDDAVWEYFQVNLDDFTGQSIYLLVEAADHADPSLVEAAIDDVLIEVRQE